MICGSMSTNGLPLARFDIFQNLHTTINIKELLRKVLGTSVRNKKKSIQPQLLLRRLQKIPAWTANKFKKGIYYISTAE